jgi:hypothetical protein
MKLAACVLTVSLFLPTVAGNSAWAQGKPCPGLTGDARRQCLESEIRAARQESERLNRKIKRLDKAIAVFETAEKGLRVVNQGAGAATGAAVGTALGGPGGAVVGAAAGAAAADKAYDGYKAIGTGIANAGSKGMETARSKVQSKKCVSGSPTGGTTPTQCQ